MPADIQHHHPTDIYVLRPCHHPDASDLVAIGGDYFVDVIQVTETKCLPVASFHVGSRITALAWSSNTVSPSSSSNAWSIELIAASSDFGLHSLSKSSSEAENIFPFGGGLSGHHGKINDMVFCGGWHDDSSRYVATVSDDKMMMIWDLYPTAGQARSASPEGMDASHSPGPRAQPTAYVIPFPHPLASIRSHPSTSKEFMIADCRGSIFLTDWRSDPEDIGEEGSLRHSSLIELVDPHALSLMGTNKQWSASIDWRADASEIVGGVFGSKFSLWDISKLRGGTPFMSGPSFSEGGNVFRWCRTFPEHFAISTQSSSKGAVIHVHNCSFVHAPPAVFNLHNKPLFVRDFDFLSLPGIPRIAAAVGRDVMIFAIGVDA